MPRRCGRQVISAACSSTLALVLLGACAAHPQAPSPDEQVFTQNIGEIVVAAQEKLAASPQDLDGAVADLSRAAASGPSAYELGVILYMRGGAKYQLGDPAGAQADWTRALAEGALSETEHENLRYNLSQLEPPPQ